uniref:Uncharacterized protein n=1 Tax=Setaria viridis TaxID=4556 RepID=A0A4U6TTD8_SETVI|nr:hypothetical protein SEVIR_8G144500v2 [Setaria viridis]
MLKVFHEADFIKKMVADLHDDEDGLIEPESHTDHNPAHSIGNVQSPTNEVRETSTKDRMSLPSEQTVANSIHEDNGNAATNFSQDPILKNMVKKATSSNLKQPSDATFQGRREAAMERGARTGNEA